VQKCANRVDLNKSFNGASEYTLAHIGVDAAENEPSKVTTRRPESIVIRVTTNYLLVVTLNPN